MAEETSWAYLPEPIFLHLASYTSVEDLLSMCGTCRQWYGLCQDDYLWKKLFRRDFKVDPSIGLRPGKIALQCGLELCGGHMRNANSTYYRCKIVEMGIQAPNGTNSPGQDRRADRACPPSAPCQLFAQWRYVFDMLQGRPGHCKCRETERELWEVLKLANIPYLVIKTIFRV